MNYRNSGLLRVLYYANRRSRNAARERKHEINWTAIVIGVIGVVGTLSSPIISQLFEREKVQTEILADNRRLNNQKLVSAYTKLHEMMLAVETRLKNRFEAFTNAQTAEAELVGLRTSIESISNVYVSTTTTSTRVIAAIEDLYRYVDESATDITINQTSTNSNAAEVGGQRLTQIVYEIQKILETCISLLESDLRNQYGVE